MLLPGPVDKGGQKTENDPKDPSPENVPEAQYSYFLDPILFLRTSLQARK